MSILNFEPIFRVRKCSINRSFIWQLLKDNIWSLVIIHSFHFIANCWAWYWKYVAILTKLDERHLRSSRKSFPRKKVHSSQPTEKSLDCSFDATFCQAQDYYTSKYRTHSECSNVHQGSLLVCLKCTKVNKFWHFFFPLNIKLFSAWMLIFKSIINPNAQSTMLVMNTSIEHELDYNKLVSDQKFDSSSLCSRLHSWTKLSNDSWEIKTLKNLKLWKNCGL